MTKLRPSNAGGMCRWLTVLVCFALSIVAAEAQSVTRRKTLASPAAARTADAGDLEALAKFHAYLSGFDAGKRSDIAILQIGDSHTAADHFTGRLRTLLQLRFGNGGRGFLPPGAPHDYYRPHQVAVAQSAGWKTLTSNKTTPDAVPFGLSGQVARATAADEMITIDNRSAGRLKAFEIGVNTQPGGGAFEIYADGQPLAAITTAAAETGTESYRIAVPRLVQRIVLRTYGDGPVEITDHTLLGEARGLTLSNLGFIGAQVSIMSRWDWPRAAAQIASLDPALIIVAFGTNEGHAPVGSIEARYARQLEERLAALKVAAPNASLVVVGTPDANRYPRFCLPPTPPIASLQPEMSASSRATPAPGGSGAAAADLPSGPIQVAPSGAANGGGVRTKIVRPPPPEPPADAICQTLDVAERQAYEQMLADKDRRLCRWHTPPAIPVVRALQREVAARQGALFYDWFALFETECGADRWFRQGLAHKDRVHFKQDGYWRAADQLYARLLAGYPPPKR